MRDHQIFEERKLVSTMQELDSVLISLPISLFVTVIEQPNSAFCYGISLLKKLLMLNSIKTILFSSNEDQFALLN